MKPFIVPVLAILCMAPACAQVTDSTPVIEASGIGFTKAEFEDLVKGDSRYRGVVTTPGGRRALAVDFGKAFALEAEARKRKLDLLPSVQLKIRHATQQLLAYELLTKLRADFLKDESALAAEYDKSKQRYSQPQVRQILVRAKGSEVALRSGQRALSLDEARAKAVSLRAKLVAGADFAALARAESDDLGSRDKGGDVGAVLRGATGANFEAAAFSLAVGKLSDVVQTEQGFHILRVEERKPQALPAVKAMIANDLAHRELEAILLNGYKLNEAYFSP